MPLTPYIFFIETAARLQRHTLKERTAGGGVAGRAKITPP